MPPGEALDPFAVVVDASQETSLASISTQTAVSLVDLRRLNPGLATHAFAEPLPAGTVVHMPPVLAQRGNPYGSYFTIGSMEEALRALDAKLDMLVRQEKSPLPELPARKVLSKTERIVTVVREESERQLARIKEEYAECGNRPNLLQFLVDVEPVKQLREAVEQDYDGNRLQLRALDSANHETFSKPLRHQENAVTRSSRHIVRDTSEDFCLQEHSHQWEFTFLAPESSLEVQDSWAVLSCQTLGALLDTFECRNCLPVNMSKNAFLFIGGTFYVDNRHASVEGENYEDLTAAIRHFRPLQGKDAACGENAAFGRCPVKYVSQTTFADLDVRLGEFGVLRHLGWCNHYFYLSSVESLRGLGYRCREKGAYPYRVMKAPTRVVRCRMCRQFPATIACYNDELSPDSPCPYCVPCFELLHATDEGTIKEDNFIAIKLPDGKYFTL
ncbi:small nuclear RNA gene activation protein (SNAP) 50 [Trypanosoma grayi]|uniref:small nuclear RNA gene activation protein (SNAP) 50 n=1 Tax=Trypanosoma grayi TaxID=71804 RepID=UPI0004F4B66B|nr:small nuclear RNA gene activation protein (SNAP) 50 [Trypanosoma grayi]KEG10831.1 small nuclear RNA gene activation protein (SNAP) 50 [Trypanosoma grayi]